MEWLKVRAFVGVTWTLANPQLKHRLQIFGLILRSFFLSPTCRSVSDVATLLIYYIIRILNGKHEVAASTNNRYGTWSLEKQRSLQHRRESRDYYFEALYTRTVSQVITTNLKTS